MAEEVVSETDSGLPYGRVVVVEARFLEIPAEARNTEFADATRIDEAVARRTSKLGVGISDVAERIVGRSVEIFTVAEVQRESFRDAIVVLNEQRVRRDAVIMVVRTSSALGNQGRP